MRDYAKKSFKPTPAPAFNTPGNIPPDLNKDPSKNNAWQFWGVALAIALGGLFTVQMIYKHFHHEPLPSAQNSQNTQNAPIKTLPTSNPNTPPKPVFDFYNMLPKQTPTPSSQTNQANQANPTNSTMNQPAPILSAAPIPKTQQNNTAAPIATVSNNSNSPIPAAPANNSASANKPSQYLIQVGAYRNKDAARSMQARLLLLGLHPNISSMDSGWYRVTLGPFSSINSAKNIRHKLQNARINNADIKPVTTNSK